MTEILHFEILRKHGQTHKQTDMGITIPRPPPMGGEVNIKQIMIRIIDQYLANAQIQLINMIHVLTALVVSLSQQSLAAVSQVSYMSDLKKNIETNFPAIKESIGNLQDRGQTPCLSEQHKQW